MNTNKNKIYMYLITTFFINSTSKPRTYVSLHNTYKEAEERYKWFVDNKLKPNEKNNNVIIKTVIDLDDNFTYKEDKEGKEYTIYLEQEDEKNKNIKYYRAFQDGNWENQIGISLTKYNEDKNLIYTSPININNNKYVITRFCLDSDKHNYTYVKFYEKYEEAKMEYQKLLEDLKEKEEYSIVINKIVKNLYNGACEYEHFYCNSECVRDDVKRYYHDCIECRNAYTQQQFTVYLTQKDENNIEYYRAYQDGNWKRPVGVSLTKMKINNEEHDLYTFPDKATYN